MEIIKNILINYWQPIIGVVCLIVSFILQLIKKKPVIDYWHYIYKLLPEAINEAEKTSLKGEDKLYAALRILLQLLDAYDIQVPRTEYLNILAEIEEILSTPQKKVK